MIKWNRFRRESGHVLGASELLELAELLREVDKEFQIYEAEYHLAWSQDVPGTNPGAPGRIRDRLEKLLGMHPGSLDTSRDV